MRELNVKEIKEVNGGCRWCWQYIATKTVDFLMKSDWGDSSGNPDTNLAP